MASVTEECSLRQHLRIPSFGVKGALMCILSPTPDVFEGQLRARRPARRQSDGCRRWDAGCLRRGAHVRAQGGRCGAFWILPAGNGPGGSLAISGVHASHGDNFVENTQQQILTPSSLPFAGALLGQPRASGRETPAVQRGHGPRYNNLFGVFSVETSSPAAVQCRLESSCPRGKRDSRRCVLSVIILTPVLIGRRCRARARRTSPSGFRCSK
jgi:hypothetical protein